MGIITIISFLFLIAGCFFVVVASIGIIRFPDVYSRIHPAGTSDTLGQALIFFGLIIYEGFSLISLKLLFIVIFIFITSPTATHALVNAAHVAGLKPWKKGDDRKTSFADTLIQIICFISGIMKKGCNDD